jgi:hypothetical protein
VCVCVKLGCKWLTGAETFEVLEVTIGVLATERTQMFVWFHKFQWGAIHVENGKCWDVCQQTKYMNMFMNGMKEHVL